MSQQPTLIQSVQRALHVMEALAGRHGRATVKQLARDAGLTLPTTYHLVRTLAHEGYLAKLDDGSVVLTSRLGDLARDSAPVTAAVRSILADLRDKVGAAVYLAEFIDGEICVTETVESAKAPRIDLWVGMHNAGHATALGKAILGQLSENQQRDYLSQHRPEALTQHTMTTISQVLAAVDSRGQQANHPPTAQLHRDVALDNQEYSLGVSCLASPLAAADGTLAAVGIAVPSRRLSREPGLRDHVRATATQVERALSLSS
jgi:DNA-binding IclR family transcriptional regulator